MVDGDEDFFARAFGADRRLAAYGSLAPGRANHHLLAPLGGEWRAGLTVEGERVELGWGAALGFPALRWRPGATGVAVHLLTSERLPESWERLDAFEGRDYVRVLVPLHEGPRLAAVANLYEAAPAPDRGRRSASSGCRTTFLPTCGSPTRCSRPGRPPTRLSGPHPREADSVTTRDFGACPHSPGLG
jgi:gamma-glutamylcyclotransferase (GGCT)/AIG2-like uncharacterized protein YtfP